MKGISVIIPTYNREKFIIQAIESVLEQKLPNPIEIIISDDGSTDKTVAISESYGSRVRVLLKPDDCLTQGASGARNRGIAAASNPYISFLDSDDYWLPGHLQKMVRALESKPHLGFAFCRILELDETKSDHLFRAWTKAIITPRDVTNLIVSKHNVVQTNALIFKREVFENVGVFNTNLRNAEDIDMWMRISELYPGTFSNHYGAVLRRHGLTQLTDVPKEQLLKCHAYIFDQAAKRYKTLRLNSRYRFFKLGYITWKYNASQVPMFYQIYSWIHKFKDSRKSNEKDWFPLSHFVQQKVQQN